MQRVIYDFGANKGDNLPYYLLKADKVVAVEAIPSLADSMRARFAPDVASGKLVVENAVIAEESSSERVPFFIHRTMDFLSQFPPPADPSQFDRVDLPALSPLEIIQRHGEPWYVKIDLEHFDSVVLAALLNNGVVPPFISAECHTVEVFARLVCAGYGAFNVVESASVHKEYAAATIHTQDGDEHYAFARHSAGPFGDDIASPWMTPSNFFRVLALRGLGWRDVHATNRIEPDPAYMSQLHLREYSPALSDALRKIVPGSLHPFARRIRNLF
jgi:FkbM family methyltransferase